MLSKTNIASMVGLEIPVAEAPAELHRLLFQPPADVVSAVIRWGQADPAA